MVLCGAHARSSIKHPTRLSEAQEEAPHPVWQYQSDHPDQKLSPKTDAVPSQSSRRDRRSRPGPTYFAPPKQRRIGGMWASGPEDPRPKILGHIGRGGASHDAGRSRVSVRRSVQAVRGFVIRQRPRVGSKAVIPSRRLSVRRGPKTRLWGRPSLGRPIASFMGSTE